MTQKLERVLQLQLLLLLPSQLALHFWPSWSLINGIRVDYLSPTLYFTDLIIFGLFLSSRLRVRVSLPVIIFVVLNILISYSPLVSLYKWLRALEYFWLFKYLVQNIHKSSIINLKSLSLAVIWTAALAWWQFFLQHSVGGLWWWLGERPLSVTAPLIAKVSFSGQIVMRSYATFPHPNALAGFLLVSALLLYRRVPWATALALLTIPITFSRSAIILEIGILIIGIYLKIVNWKLKIATALAVVVSSIYFLLSTTGSISSLPERIYLILNSLFLIFKSPFLGVGLGNFLPSAGLFQPVHNIYLLLASELGLPAFLIIGYYVCKNYLKIGNWKLKIAILVVAATGLVDHYWLTLHQTSLMLVLLLSLLYAKSDKHILRRGSQR